MYKGGPENALFDYYFNKRFSAVCGNAAAAATQVTSLELNSTLAAAMCDFALTNTGGISVSLPLRCFSRFFESQKLYPGMIGPI
jgi:hypothetical protein